MKMCWKFYQSKEGGKADIWEKSQNVTTLLCINGAINQFTPLSLYFQEKMVENRVEKDVQEGSSFDAQENG